MWFPKWLYESLPYVNVVISLLVFMFNEYVNFFAVLLIVVSTIQITMRSIYRRHKY